MFAVLSAVSLTGCSSIESLLSGDKIDYRTSGASARSSGLEVPPDLTQLTRDSRYQPIQGGAVSAAAYQSGTAAAAPATVPASTVAARSAGDVRMERLGNERWLRTSLTPEQLWPQVQGFWKERGFVLVQDQAAAGVMETDWAENRGKIPMDLIRGTIGKVFDGAYSTGELDKFRTRVERVDGGGSEVYITHRGMIEVVRGERKDSTTWQPRLADPQLEGEMLSRLMLKLGATEEVTKAAVVATSGPAAAARARLLPDRPAASLQVDDSFDRAWRRVGVALDRSGFTVEDRDRAQGLYFIRYADPAFAGKDEPNFIAKLFSFGKKDNLAALARYRVMVKAEGERSTVSVLDGQGTPETGDVGKRITTMLLEELK
ncbi:MAG: outer membrane protein assembly factor BamC [Bacteriovorax sp.]|nr:outer membrane protein assembly factor BamC [Rhizobacter sp.]